MPEDTKPINGASNKNDLLPDELKKRIALLEERYSSLVRILPDVVFRMKESGLILDMYASRQPQVVNIPISQCAGSNIRDIFPPAAAMRMLECWTMAVVTKKLQEFEFNDVRGKQESSYEARCLVSGVDEVVFIVRDVSDKKDAEHKISRLLFQVYNDNEDLRKMARVKDDFISQISHELRTPLTSILGYMKLLAGGASGILNEKQVEFVDVMLNNANRLYEMINNLLDLTRSQSEQFKLFFTKMGVSRLLDNSASAVKGLATNKKVSIALHPPGQDATIWVDAPKMERVFINLLGNAVKFTPAGGRVEVDYDHESWNGRMGVHIRVKDNGVGIPQEDLTNIFLQFFQVDNSSTRKVGGSGLGLTISKRIVEMHGGDIWAESVEGQGSTFHVFLPERSDMIADEASG